MLALLAFACLLASPACAAAPAERSEQIMPVLEARSRSVAGDFAGARAVLDQSLAKSPESPALLDGLGALQQDMGDYLRAERSYRTALLKWRPGDDLLRARILNDLATLYIETAQWSKLEGVSKELETVPLDAIESSPADAANVLSTRAAIRRSAGDYAGAQKLYERSIEEWGRARNGAALMAYVQTSLANMQFEYGDVQRAGALFKQALERMEASVGPNHAMLIRPLYGLAVSEFQAGDAAAAEPIARRAVELSRRAMGSDHPTTASMVALQADIFRKLGRKREAGALKREADSILRSVSARNLSGHTVDLRQLARDK